VLVADNVFRAENIFGNASSLVSSASSVAPSAFSKRSAFCQQQIAQAIQHRRRLVIGHRDGDQQRNRLLIAGKGAGRAADGNGAAQVAFSAVVQPDALTEVQRFIVNRAANKGSIDGAGFFQTRGVQRLQGQQVAGDTSSVSVSLSSFSASLCFSPINRARSSSAVVADLSCSATESSLSTWVS
jgi:hypothetical protein